MGTENKFPLTFACHMPQNTMLLLLSQLLKAPKASLEGGVCLPNAAERSVLSPENQDPIPLPANVWSPGLAPVSCRARRLLGMQVLTRFPLTQSGSGPAQVTLEGAQASARLRNGGNEYLPKRVRVLPSRAPEQAARASQGSHCRMLTRTVQPSSRFHSPHQAGPGGVVTTSSSPKEEGGASGLRSRLALRSSAPLTAAANQRPVRRGHFLVGRQGGLRSSLVRVSRIGCARVPSGRGQRRLGAQFPSACGAPAAEPGSSA